MSDTPPIAPDPRFAPTPDGVFLQRWGKSAKPGQAPPCSKKLCFVATDRTLLSDVLYELALEPDCWFVKFSVEASDGMFLGRCFMLTPERIGTLWARFKPHPRLLCSVQDDDFVARYR